MLASFTVSDLDGWLSPQFLNGYGDFQGWLLLIPLGLLVLGAVLPAFHRIPSAIAWSGFAGFILLGLVSFWGVAFHGPQVKADAITADYVEWFDSNYEYLGLTGEEKLGLLYNPYGFLDEGAKKLYILDSVDGESDVKYVYYLSSENENEYLLAPQKVDEFPAVEK